MNYNSLMYAGCASELEKIAISIPGASRIKTMILKKPAATATGAMKPAEAVTGVLNPEASKALPKRALTATNVNAPASESFSLSPSDLGRMNVESQRAMIRSGRAPAFSSAAGSYGDPVTALRGTDFATVGGQAVRKSTTAPVMRVPRGAGLEAAMIGVKKPRGWSMGVNELNQLKPGVSISDIQANPLAFGAKLGAARVAMLAKYAQALKRGLAA